MHIVCATTLAALAVIQICVHHGLWPGRAFFVRGVRPADPTIRLTITAALPEATLAQIRAEVATVADVTIDDAA
jgi:hypothetical protein